MKIRFYNKETEETLIDSYYFVDSDGDVYKDNEWETESQEATVCFDSFAEKCENVGWEAYQEYETI